VNQNLLPGTIRAAQCAVLLIALVVAPIHAQAAPVTEKIRATSPDGKFAMQITYDAEVNDQMIKAEMADFDGSHNSLRNHDRTHATTN